MSGLPAVVPPCRSEGGSPLSTIPNRISSLRFVCRSDRKRTMPDTPSPLAGLSVLIVEDEPLLLRQLTAHLERLGADVTGAGTLAAATRLIAELQIDFALL